MKTKVFVLILMGIGFFYRIYGLNLNHSFWNDESHVAIFSRAILNHGWPQLTNGYATGAYQFILYWLTALSMYIFGMSESAARFPSVLFGTATIGIVFLLGREIFSRKVGLLTAILITFLQIEIVWSRQARPYQALQLFFLLGAYFIYRISLNIGSKNTNILSFCLCVVFALGFHGLGLVILVSGVGYLCLMNLKSNFRYLLLSGMLIIVSDIVFGWHGLILNNLFKQDNLFYYHVFLTHNYLPICLYALIGFIVLLIRKDKNKLLLLACCFLPQLFIVAYILPQPFVRYFYIVFPFIMLLAVYGLTETTKILIERVKIKPLWLTRSLTTIIVLFTLFIPLLLQKKILWRPTITYSLNSDMQEIPEVDWNKIYGFVGSILSQDNNTILITNWNDQPIWYFGEKFKESFIVIRTPNKTMNKVDIYGERKIYSIKELEDIRQAYQRGIIIADSWDNAVPEGYREYLRANFKLIMESDRLYPIQPRYWTVWVYGWGLE